MVGIWYKTIETLYLKHVRWNACIIFNIRECNVGVAKVKLELSADSRIAPQSFGFPMQEVIYSGCKLIGFENKIYCDIVKFN